MTKPLISIIDGIRHRPMPLVTLYVGNFWMPREAKIVNLGLKHQEQ